MDYGTFGHLSSKKVYDRVGLSLWTNPQDYIERFGILSKNKEDISFSIFEYLILGSFWTLFRDFQGVF